VAVQLLENWLLKEQEKIQTKYRELNQVSVLEPDIIFIGDSIDLERVIQSIAREYPLSQIKLLSILPVNEGEEHKQTVYIRTNEKIKEWNQAYEALASAYMQVDFVSIYDSLTDSEGQLQSAYTTDGLHLSVAGYQALSEALKGCLF